MKAAVTDSFEHPPGYQEFALPVVEEGKSLIRVQAALSQLVKSQAAGKHYSSDAQFPFILGIDGVGRRPNGCQGYLFLPRRPFGAMAEFSVVRDDFCVLLPDHVGDTLAALTERAHFKAGKLF